MFRTNLDKKLEKLETSNEGRENPHTVAVLREIQKQIEALKKAKK